MLAAYAVRADPESPLDALVVDEIEPPKAPDGWVRVHVKTAALNLHDVWSLREVGLLPTGYQ
jgi:NADPH:quinone reductase-like Zn-dependent oxidoreductase